MKLIIKIFGVIFGIWVVLMLVGFFLPGHFRVERRIVIAASPAAIYPLVSDLRAWKGWGVWFARDPDMKISYSPATTEVGAWSQWTSKSQGDGKMTISSTHPNDLFEYRMEFSDMGMVSLGGMRLTPVDRAGTEVSMTMEGDLARNPMYRWFGLFMDKLVGPDFEAGLVNLKRLSETRAR
jgi:polyketide cyclase/dehydrase/lipid transport protein